jgi:DNA-binding winged helix-turn-helix (wHTH) protein
VADVTYVPFRVDDVVTSIQWVLVSLERPLFESEDREDPNPELARRWLNVYGELTAATEALMGEASDRAERLGRIARAEFEDAHQHDLDARLTRARQGLAFWRRRHASLVDLEFDFAHGLVTHRNRTLRMTRRELQLLNLLLGHPGQWYRASALMVQAWHSSYLAEEQLRTYVVRLRKKLAQLEAPCHIVNQRGRGYALVFGESPADIAIPGYEGHAAESSEAG